MESKAESDSNSCDNNLNPSSGYEYLRHQKIKDNFQRMQKLGILDLSLKLKTNPSRSPKRIRSISSDKKSPPPAGLPGSARRSSRLKCVGPVSYKETEDYKKRDSEKPKKICLPKGLKPEIYTEEHERLLGDCKTSWTLAVDGYGEDGKRVYDPVSGKSCHQCRQKTLGHHTHCIKCNSGQGQFCGDCLYMRYGENVMEATENPNWICPGCRGICNCSLCRQANGWLPTGNLYRRVLALGYKSVAHYLIHTYKCQPKLEGNEDCNSLSSQELTLYKSPEEH